jgi:hypothetical protein
MLQKSDKRLQIKSHCCNTELCIYFQIPYVNVLTRNMVLYLHFYSFEPKRAAYLG